MKYVRSWASCKKRLAGFGQKSDQRGDFIMSKYQSNTKYELRQNIKPKIAPLTAAVTGALAAGSLQAAVITVDTLEDGFISDKCSLRSALYSANSGLAHNGCEDGTADGFDEIVFASGLSGTINMDASVASWGDGSFLTAGRLSIDGDNRITVAGDGNRSVFYAKYEPDGFRSDELELKNLTITGGSGNYGGGVLSYAKTLTLTAVEVVDNFALHSGGGVWHEPFDGEGSLHISNSVISGNATFGGDGGGVGVRMDRVSSILQIKYSSFIDNGSGTGSGGGLHLDIAQHSNNLVRENYFYGNESKYNGGAINAVLGNTTTTLSDNTFYLNDARENGGGVFLTESMNTNDLVTVNAYGNNFYGNRAGELGGGVYLDVRHGSQGSSGNPRKTVKIVQGGFWDNLSGEGGGGIFMNLEDEVASYISGVEFLFNQTAKSGGGALLVEAYDSGVYLQRDSFIFNSAEKGDGGGAQINAAGGKVYASGLLAIGNESQDGSGGGVSIVAIHSRVGVENAGFYGNEASSCGGGLRISGRFKELGVGKSIFRNNTASCGGGTSIWEQGTASAILEVKYSEFSGNISQNHGGGAHFRLDHADNSLFVSNSTFSNNENIAENGSALRLFGNTKAEIKYSTFANNSAASGGAALVSDGNSCRVNNSLFGDNRDINNAPRDLSGLKKCEVRNSLVQGASNSDFIISGSRNILNEDPMIGPLQDNGGFSGSFGDGGYTHALLDGSPAIDAGSVGLAPPDHDQRGPGFQRVSRLAVDMGAYELQDGIFSDRFEKP